MTHIKVYTLPNCSEWMLTNRVWNEPLPKTKPTTTTTKSRIITDLKINLWLVSKEDVTHEIRGVHVRPTILGAIEKLLQIPGDVYRFLGLGESHLYRVNCSQLLQMLS